MPSLTGGSVKKAAIGWYSVVCRGTFQEAMHRKRRRGTVVCFHGGDPQDEKIVPNYVRTICFANPNTYRHRALLAVELLRIAAATSPAVIISF